MSAKVLDFNQKRKDNIETKRRNFERILFQNFLGADSVIDQNGTIYPITLVDVSHEGCLFQIPWDLNKEDKYPADTEILLRMYFSKKSYIPTVVKVKYGNEFIDNGQTYMQYGCEFDKSMPSFEAMSYFIEFLYKFAEHSVIDKGDNKSYFL